MYFKGKNHRTQKPTGHCQAFKGFCDKPPSLMLTFCRCTVMMFLPFCEKICPMVSRLFGLLGEGRSSLSVDCKPSQHTRLQVF